MTTKEEFKKELNEWIETWTRRIDDLETQLHEARSHTDLEILAECRDKVVRLKNSKQEMETAKSELETADDEGWMHLKEKVEAMVGTMDTEFRQSLAYFH